MMKFISSKSHIGDELMNSPFSTHKRTILCDGRTTYLHMLAKRGHIPYDTRYVCNIFDAVRAGFGMRQNNNGYICSEYVARILKDMGVSVNEWGNSPVKLMEKVIKSASVEVVDLL